MAAALLWDSKHYFSSGTCRSVATVTGCFFIFFFFRFFFFSVTAVTSEMDLSGIKSIPATGRGWKISGTLNDCQGERVDICRIYGECCG